MGDATLDRQRNRDEAQRAPSARPRFVDVSRECAQTPWVLIIKSGDFPAEFHACDGLKTRRLRECKISISEVLISATLSVRGEVAERPKAAVCKGCQESQNGPEIDDFRSVSYWIRGWRWLLDDSLWTAFGHTRGHTSTDATVPVTHTCWNIRTPTVISASASSSFSARSTCT